MVEFYQKQTILPIQCSIKGRSGVVSRNRCYGEIINNQSKLGDNLFCWPADDRHGHVLCHCCLVFPHSHSQRLRSFWSAPRIANSGQVWFFSACTENLFHTYFQPAFRLNSGHVPLTGSQWITDFRCWTFQEVTVLGTDQKEHSLWGWDWFCPCGLALSSFVAFAFDLPSPTCLLVHAGPVSSYVHLFSIQSGYPSICILPTLACSLLALLSICTYPPIEYCLSTSQCTFG